MIFGEFSLSAFSTVMSTYNCVPRTARSVFPTLRSKIEVDGIQLGCFTSAATICELPLPVRNTPSVLDIQLANVGIFWIGQNGRPVSKRHRRPKSASTRGIV